MEDDEMVTIEVAVTQSRYAYLSDLASQAGVSIRTTAGVFLEKGLKGDMGSVPPPFNFATSEDELLRQLAVVRAYVEQDYPALLSLLTDYPYINGLLLWVAHYVDDAEERLAPRDVDAGRQVLLDIVKRMQGRAVREAFSTGHNGAEEIGGPAS